MNILPTSQTLYETIEQKRKENNSVQAVADLAILSMIVARIDEIDNRLDNLHNILSIVKDIQDTDSAEELKEGIRRIIRHISINVSSISEQYESLEEEGLSIANKLKDE